MNQMQIKKLLKEAARPMCKRPRREEILRLLLEGFAQPFEERQVPWTEADEECAGIIQSFVYEVFWMVCRLGPEEVPRLFPVIAMFCGDGRERSWLADIDWSLVDKED